MFSDQQLNGLEERFESQKYLSTPERVELASLLNLSETQVSQCHEYVFDYILNIIITIYNNIVSTIYFYYDNPFVALKSMRFAKLSLESVYFRLGIFHHQ